MRLGLTIVACVPLLLGACGAIKNAETRVQPSGVSGTRNYDVTDFTAVDLRGSDDVEVSIGSGFAVRAEGDTAILDRLEIEKRGDTLRIGRKGNSWGWSGNDKGVKVYVTMPRVAAASVAGSANMTIERAEGDFKGSIAGSGNLNVADLRGSAVDLSIAGSGDLTAAGVAQTLSMSIAGAGDIEAPALKAGEANVSIAGSGNVRAAVSGEAKVSILGSGNATLTGGARCSISAVGSGEAHCS